MNESDIKIGAAYRHAVHGNCIVVHKNRRGFWISVWGGPCDDKAYTLKGIQAKDLSHRGGANRG